MLSVRGLVKSFKQRPVVQGVDLDVGPGEIVGLLGRNGAGKTTTFRMTMGMLRPDVGRIEFLGQDVTGWPMYRRARAGMGYLPQEHSVFRDLSVEENLLVVLERLDLSRAERRRECEGLLAEYGLADKRRQLAGSLSGGQQRRLEIARALITRPKLMLLDEPFAAVDPIMVGDIQATVFGLRERGISVFITDHKETAILRTVDRVYLVHEGRVVVHGKPAEILASEVAREVYLGRDFQLELGPPRAEPGSPGTEPAAATPGPEGSAA